jgi:hypothetical protein
LAHLTSIFLSTQIQAKVFKPCFPEKEFPRVPAYLMQIKEIRNRRAHEISDTLQITARQAYQVCEAMCRVFELMTIQVPVSYHEELWLMKLNALHLLNVEEAAKIQRYKQLGGSSNQIFEQLGHSNDQLNLGAQFAQMT